MNYFTSRILKQLSVVFTFCILSFSTLNAQTFEWVSGYQGTNDVFGQNVVTDDLDNVYSVGFFFGTADFDPSASSTVNLTSLANQDIYVTKLDANGALVWAHSFGNANRNRGNNIAIDANGDIYVTGYFENEVDFDPGPGTANLTSTSVVDAFVLKLDSDGNFIWVRQFGSTVISEGLDVAVDNNGDVLIGGYFRGDCDFDMKGSGRVLSSVSGTERDAFLTKLSSAGDFIWVRHQGGALDGRTEAITVDAANNIYGTGFFDGTFDFDLVNNPGVELEGTNGGQDIFVYKLNSAGDFQWSVSAGAGGNDIGNGIEVNSNGLLFITGQFENTVDFDPDGGPQTIVSGGGTDSYLWSLDDLGVFNWINRIGGSGADVGYDLGVNPTGSPYVTGNFSNTADFDGTTSLTSAGSLDIFVSKYLDDGTLSWVQQFSGGSNNYGFGIHVTDNSDVLSTGYFRNTVDFDPTGTNTSLTSSTVRGAYVHKISQSCGSVITNVDALSTALCPGIVDSTKVYVDGTLNDAVEWAWYEGSCGGTYIGSGDSLTVRPSTTTTYFVRGEGACTTVPCQSVTVNVDNTPPVITLTTPITVYTDAGACYYRSDSLTPPTVTDVDCGVDTVYNDADVVLLLGTTTVTWTAVDVNGNTSTETQDVTVLDTVSPTIAAPADITVSADASCQATVTLGSSAADDNCAVDTVFNDAPATFPLGTTIVTWTVEDPSGNSSTDTQEVVVEDNTDPVINGLPTDIATSNDAGNCGAIVSWTEPTVTDNCIGAGIIQTAGIPNGDPFPVGVTTVEYTAVDGSGNEVTGTFTVTVTDNENPTIAAPADVSVNANNFCTAFSVALGNPVTSDNCTGSTITNDGPAIYPLGSTVVTWTITDAAGNMATATQNVTVTDNQDPSIVAPADIELSADTNCEATVSDLGSPISSDNCSVVSVTNNAPAAFTLGVTTVIWEVTDGSGNTSTDTQEVTVIDEIDPVIVDLPADITSGNDVGNCGAIVSWTEPTVTDNCIGAGIIQTAGIPNGDPFPIGVTTVEYTATDGSGNSVSASFTVTVTDDENPTITAAADTIVEANNFCVAINIALNAPTVNDNCSVISVENDAPIAYPLGNTIVTWTVTDAAGNTSIATQNVTVADSTAPTITAPLPVTAYVDDSCEVAGVNLGTPTTFDNCSVDTFYNDAPAIYTTGSYTVTWVAEDAAGNVSFATQNVTIKDTIMPLANLMDTTITLSPDGTITVLGSDIDLGSTDNCGLSEVVLLQEIYDCKDIGVNQIGVEVIDVHGNVLNTFITVTVVESGIDLDFDMIDDACDDNVNTTVVDVPSGFTPNGDGINDMFIIPGMSQYSAIRLTIFNRYGNRVYESEQYENDWDGTSSKNGKILPDGTYFYVLELDGGDRYNGYVQINRTL